MSMHPGHDTPAGARIDTVVYDFGNVLVRWDPYGAFASVATREEVEAFFTEIDFPAFNHLQDAGRTWAEARAELAGTHPHLVAMLDAYVENFAATLGPVPGSEELVRELKDLGLRLLGLTNWSSDLFHHAEPVAPAIGLMDDVVVSGRVGVAKPDPAIFEHLISEHDVDPARTLFVDDSPANVATAHELGFRTADFTDVPTLRATLRDLGVPVSGVPEHPHPRYTR